MSSEKDKVESSVASGGYLRFRRGVGHTAALVAAARDNEALRIVAYSPTAKRINRELGREQAVTPEFLHMVQGSPIVFDNAVVENLIRDANRCSQTVPKLCPQM